jgi:S-adenosylmethionine:tRNA-ribosyltransferase-isomerase (queuine synthetase)
MTSSDPPVEISSELSEFDYDFPRELIAQHPLANRSDSRLLVVRRDEGEIEHHHFRDLPDLLRSGDALALNDSKVVMAPDSLEHQELTRSITHLRY